VRRRRQNCICPTSASMLFSREKLLMIGRKEPFDSDRFTMEYSDIDLAIDFLCHGLLCFVSPSSKVYHKYKFKMTSQMLYRLEMGRYRLLGHISNATLSRMRRALILTEIMIWYFFYQEAGPNRSQDPSAILEAWLCHC
jgi:GT2 family glycosyltransferase